MERGIIFADELDPEKFIERMLGTGYPYAFPNAQITYRSPVMNGFRIAVGIIDPSDTTSRKDAAGNDLGKSYQKNPRFETEVTYQLDVGDTKIYSWINGIHQTSNSYRTPVY